MDESQLIAAAQQGHLPAFNQLILEYQMLAYNVAYRVLGEQDAAADATQEAFIKAYKSLGQYRGGSFKAWLLRIVTNACYDTLRAMQRRPTTPLEHEQEDPEHATELMDADEGPEERAMRAVMSEAIQAGIATLPEDQRVVLILSDIEGMSYHEIAEATGAELGTIKSRLSRARARLRDFLRSQPELLPLKYRLQSKEST